MDNAENYGSSSFVFVCPTCKKKTRIYIMRLVKIGSISKAQDDEDTSFGE